MKYLSKFMSMLLVGAMLYSTGCANYDEDINGLKQEIEDVKTELNGKVDPLAADLEAVQKALEDAIEAGNAKIADNKELIDALDEMAKNNDAAIKTIQNAIVDFATKGEVSAVAGDVANALKRIEANESAIKTLEENYPDLAKRLEDAEAAIADAAAAEDLIDLNDRFVAYQGETNSAIGDLESRVETAEDAIKTLKGKVEVLDTLNGKVDEMATYTKEQLDLLTNADKELNTLVTALGTNLEEYKGIVKAEFKEAYGQIADNTDRIEALRAEYEQSIKSLQAQDTAILQTLDQHTTWMVEIEERISSNEAVATEIKTNIAEMKVTIEGLTEDLAELETAMVDLQNQVTELEKNIDGELGDINTKIATLQQKLEEFMMAREEALGVLEGKVDAILNRVQSIVFVPEYSDGEATVDYAMFGGKLIEGRSTFVYQVYPAACAAAITKESLSYDVIGVKTRTGEAEELLKVVEVKGDDEGRLYVTAVARLGEEFYDNQKADYAASLILANDSANLSTEYVGLYPAKAADAAISMKIMYEGKEESINGNLEVNNGVVEYANINTEASVDFVAVPEHYLLFEYHGEHYTQAELAELGYVVEPKFSVAGDDDEAIKVYTTEEANAKGHKTAYIDFVKGDASMVGKTYTAWVSYSAGEAEVVAGGAITVTGEIAKLDFGTFNATWSYNEDVDSEVLRATHRDFVLGKYTETEGYELPNDVKITDLFASTPTTTVVKNAAGEVVEEVYANPYVLEDTVHIDFGNFAWGESYTVEYTYVTNTLDATFKLAVATEDRVREDIKIDLGTVVRGFEANMVVDDIADKLAVVFETIAARGAKYYVGVTAESWLLDMLEGGSSYECTISVDGTPAVAALAGTAMTIDAVDASKVYTSYDYSDFKKIPAKIEYTLNIVTFYGQKVTLTKTLEFTFPTFDYKREMLYVVEDENGYYSNVAVPAASDVIDIFGAQNVELEKAFTVVDSEGKEIADLDALNLVNTFYIEDNVEDIKGVDMHSNILYYTAGVPQINVRGELKIVNDNDSYYVIPTSFDKGGKFENYQVRMISPVGELTLDENANREVIVGVNSYYDINLYTALDLKDYRGFDLIGLNYWVTGNGNNGFAAGTAVTETYSIEYEWSLGNKDYAKYLTIEDGVLTFDNTNDLQITQFTVPVVLKISSKWMAEPQTITIDVTFTPRK